MAIRYTPLELDEPQLFGIGLSGTVSRADKQNLLSLADRCLDRGKLHVILDMTGLTALGGGGARVVTSGQNPVWGRNSRHLVYSTGSSLNLLDVQSGRTTTIVSGLGKVSEPTWSR